MMISAAMMYQRYCSHIDCGLHQTTLPDAKLHSVMPLRFKARQSNVGTLLISFSSVIYACGVPLKVRCALSLALLPIASLLLSDPLTAPVHNAVLVMTFTGTFAH